MREGLKGLLLATAAFVAIPAGADWLVLKDGSRVETRGAWEVKGRLVVFTSADGSLASMRTNDVDLGASEQATEAALNQADAARRLEVEEPLPGSARKAPVLVLTDADVAHVVPDAEAAE
ncbi:MAG: hypothetical protein KDD47_00815, partial [Acidobacteria bacterium]|nr:hypothetical protein [Acidobacteriota bacterium]